MGSLDRRIQELEGALSSDECPVCGDGPHASYEVVFDESEDLEDELEEPEFCAGCGRQLNPILFFDDSSPRLPKRKERERGD
jgi:NAD-dependent SIR2 family protein deacetylase